MARGAPPSHADRRDPREAVTSPPAGAGLRRVLASRSPFSRSHTLNASALGADRLHGARLTRRGSGRRRAWRARGRPSPRAKGEKVGLPPPAPPPASSACAERSQRARRAASPRLPAAGTHATQLRAVASEPQEPLPAPPARLTPRCPCRCRRWWLATRATGRGMCATWTTRTATDGA